MWFEDLMGFAERSPEHVRANIEHQGEFLVSKVNGRRVRCGRLETPSLAELRAAAPPSGAGRPEVREVVGDVGALHRDPDNAGALFQAASQFNLLEMAGPSITPEQGVGIYEHDHTQGPACATACGGGTILRNYFAAVGAHLGQTKSQQIDCLADLGQVLGQPGLWEMRNGYALASSAGLQRIDARISAASSADLDALRGHLRIGVQHDVEVIGSQHCVTQVYGSALPVAYGRPPAHQWESFARLVLEASYEATLLVARIRRIDRVYLTLLGGGVFGNAEAWIVDSVLRALELAGPVEVRIVSYGRPSGAAAAILDRQRGAGVGPGDRRSR